MNIDLRQMVIGLWFGIFVAIFSLIGATQCQDKNTIDNKSEEIESLKKEVETYKQQLDSINIQHQCSIDSLTAIKSKIHIKYVQTAEDFSDRFIVCDDDILSYISSQIQD